MPLEMINASCLTSYGYLLATEFVSVNLRHNSNLGLLQLSKKSMVALRKEQWPERRTGLKVKLEVEGPTKIGMQGAWAQKFLGAGRIT
jgi:hypothetical protein